MLLIFQKQSLIKVLQSAVLRRRISLNEGIDFITSFEKLSIYFSCYDAEYVYLVFAL